MALPLLLIQRNLGERGDNGNKHHCRTRVAYAASAELGDLHDQAVTWRVLAASEEQLKVCMSSSSEVKFPVNRAGGSSVEVVRPNPRGGGGGGRVFFGVMFKFLNSEHFLA